TVSVGTVHYMAPEVGSGNYDRTIDIYALGVMLYEMLLGRVPFSGQTMGEVLMKHLTAQPEVDELPEPFPRVIRKALAKDPKDRYQTVGEMVGEVFEVEDLDKSVATFEPASLSTVAARVAERVNVAVVAPAGGGGGVGPFGTGSSNVGQSVPPPVINPTSLPDRIGNAARVEIHGSCSRGRFGRMHNRIGSRVHRAVGRIDNSPIGRQVAQASQRPAHWAERILMALLVAGGISFGTSLLAADGNPLFATAVFFHILAIVPGVMLGCWLSFNRLHIPGEWLPRFIVTAFVGAGLVPAVLFADYALCWRAEPWVAPLLLSMLLCDWPGRLREGRKGHVQLGSAFSVGLFCLVAGLILADGYGFTVAAIAAAVSLALQVVGGLWPLAPGTDWATFQGGDSVRSDIHGGTTPLPEAAVAGGADGLTSPGVAVEAGSRAQPLERASAAIPGERPRRSTAVRSLWLFVAGLFMLTTAMAFIASGTLNLYEDDFGCFILGGIVAANYFLFALCCAIPRYKNGLWRGVFRKAVFFTGTAASGACGAALGLFHPLSEEVFLITLGCVIAGGIVSLFVWFVPVPAYVPPAQRALADGAESPRIRKGKRLMAIAGVLFVMMMGVLPIVATTVPDRDLDVVMPAVTAPLMAVAITFLVVGYRLSRRKKVKPPKLALPLRTVFEIDANANLSRLIERHMTMLGYSLASKSDLLWSFTRGNWAFQFWQSDVRRWGTRLNIAAYELDHGGYRLTCYLDIERAFNTPDQKMMVVLQDELRDLEELLGGRSVPQNVEEVPA
ncbi:MAG: hypothetical protein JXQ75_14870, partial [Phycisphaerae bacterium]|nr:hypothetical protein [Phycisphaerae bacterium]